MNCPEAFRSCLFFQVTALARHLERLADEAYRGTGLTPTQAYLLLLLAHQGDTCPGHAARVLNLAPSTVTRAVDGLERRGLVDRMGQGKTVSMTLTAAGKATLRQIEAAAGNLRQVLDQTVGDQAGPLTNALAAVVERLDQAH